MKQITFNPNNEPYYSEDFIKGFKCGAQRQLEADKADIPTWIPCSERLPSESGYYLCCNNGYLPYVGHFINGRWSDFDCTIVHADAWMPLPKPYGEREGE